MTDFVEALEPGYDRRLSDLITAAFHEACRAGSLDAAAQLVVALECEVERSIRMVSADRREDGDDVAAVRARLQREVTRLHAIQTATEAGARQRGPERLPPQLELVWQGDDVGDSAAAVPAVQLVEDADGSPPTRTSAEPPTRGRTSDRPGLPSARRNATSTATSFASSTTLPQSRASLRHVPREGLQGG